MIRLAAPQLTLSRYIKNRQILNRQFNRSLSLPSHIEKPDPSKETALLEENLYRLVRNCDFVVVDMPTGDTSISRMAHSWANIVVTLINDSFVDLDTLAVLDPDAKQIWRRGHYAEIIARARKRKLERTGPSFDWVDLRNRLSNLGARNKTLMADALAAMVEYLDFRSGAGLTERVVFHKLFLKGLTLLDLPEQRGGIALSISHVAARQELRALMKSFGISEPPDVQQAQAAIG